MAYYIDLDSKANDFDNQRIDSLEELASFIEQQKSYAPSEKPIKLGNLIIPTTIIPKRKHYIIYRGINESKYHLNTSLQLHWKDIQTYYPSISEKDYLSNLVELLKQNETIKKYESKGAQFTEIGILALMQHYGLPTPLLDWTPEIDIALNFAYDSMKPGDKDDQISNYVSLYAINLFINHELELSSYQGILVDATNRLNDLIESREMDGVNMENGSLIHLFGVKDIDQDFFYIDYSQDAPYVQDIFGTVLDLKNPNLDKQVGAFIINLDKYNYLEFLWNRKTDPTKEVVSEDIVVRNNKEYKVTTSVNPNAVGILPKTKIGCINIRKDVLEEWANKGGKKEHYVEDEQSNSLKKAVLSEYYSWLLKGEVCKKTFCDMFIGNLETESQRIAKECLRESKPNN